MIYDSTSQDEVGSIKRKTGEDWRVTLEDCGKISMTFGSAVASRAFVFGFFHGKSYGAKGMLERHGR